MGNDAPSFEKGGPHGRCRVLLVIPGKVNFFYNLYARWMAEGFQRLGAHVHLCELPDVPDGVYDLCIVSCVGEVLHAVGRDEGRRRLRDLRSASGVMMNLMAECAKTRWFRNVVDPGRELGIEDIVDVGFLPQDDVVAREGFRYHHVFDGLLVTQLQQGPAAGGPPSLADRPIPWAHIGMHTKGRVALTDRLIGHVAPNGFVYLSEVSPIKEKGSPHLNPDHMRRVLRRTAYYVWCAHHDHFFMESLRFKTAWATGCVPIKVVDEQSALPADLAFASFVLREGQVTDVLNSMDFVAARQALLDEYQRRPRFEAGLARLMDAYGLDRRDLPGLAVDRQEDTQAPRAA